MIDFADGELDHAIFLMQEKARVLPSLHEARAREYVMDDLLHILTKLAREGLGDVEGIDYLSHDCPVTDLELLAADARLEIESAKDDVEDGQLDEQRIQAIQNAMVHFLGRKAAYRMQDLEESNRKKAAKARKAKGKPAEARRGLLKEAAKVKGWNGSAPVSMSEWKTICRAFRTTYKKYKTCTRRVHNADAVAIGLRPGKKTITTK